MYYVLCTYICLMDGWNYFTNNQCDIYYQNKIESNWVKTALKSSKNRRKFQQWKITIFKGLGFFWQLQFSYDSHSHCKKFVKPKPKHWTPQSLIPQCQFGCGILKIVGPKMQDFCPRINMLKGIFFKNNPTMNYGLSKSAKIVLSKSIFYVKNQQKKLI